MAQGAWAFPWFVQEYLGDIFIEENMQKLVESLEGGSPFYLGDIWGYLNKKLGINITLVDIFFPEICQDWIKSLSGFSKRVCWGITNYTGG